MDTCIFDMLRDGIFHHLTVAGYCIKLHLVRLLHELRDDDGIVFAHLAGLAEKLFELVVVVAYVHGGTRQHIRGPYQHGEADTLYERLHLLHTRQSVPFRLVDAQGVEHGRELVPVLSPVDAHRTRAEDRHMLAVQLHGKVVRNLSANGDNHTHGILQVYHIEHTLQRQFVEIELVAHVVVGRDGLRVVVDHDTLVSKFPRCGDGVHRAPVELHTRSDAIGSRSEYDDGIIVGESYIMARSVVGDVEVVRLFLARYRRNALHERQHAGILSKLPDGKVLLLHLSFRLQDETGYLEVAESEDLSLSQNSRRNIFQPMVAFQRMLEVDDILQAVDKPRGYLCQRAYPLHRVAFFQSLSDGKDAQVGGILQLLVEVVEADTVAHKAVHTLSDHP